MQKRIAPWFVVTLAFVGCGGGSSLETSVPQTSASPAPMATIPAVNSYVVPGSVGFTGDPATLTTYTFGRAAPSGCSWQSYGLRCDQTDLTLDHVSIDGGLYWTGTGDLTIANSIIRGGLAWYVVYAAASANATGAVITVTDSTLEWNATSSVPSAVDVGPIWAAGSQAFVVKRCDIDGMPQGMDPSGNSIIDSNYIHSLVQNNPGATPTHLDGIYSQGGSNIVIERNYVDTPVRSDVTAALFIQNRTGTDTGIKIYANYLNGGAYVLRNQTGVNVDVENNTFGASLYGNVGDINAGYPGTYGSWSGNVSASGATVPRP